MYSSTQLPIPFIIPREIQNKNGKEPSSSSSSSSSSTLRNLSSNTRIRYALFTPSLYNPTQCRSCGFHA